MVCISYVLLMATYFIKDYRTVLVFNLASTAFLASGYAFLSAIAGFTSSCISLVRNATLYLYCLITKKTENKNTVLKIGLIIFTVIATIIVTIFTYENIFSLLPIIATVLFTIGICQNNTLVYKILGIPVSVLWLIYNISVFSLFGIILESVTLICVVTGLIIYLIKNKKVCK